MKLLLKLIFVFIFIKCILAQGPYDTLEECQSICKDNNACTTQNCVWYYGWFCSSNTNTCSDDSICTNDYCDPVNGTCHHTPAFSCDDNDPCTLDTCHFTLGCIHITQACNVVVPCNKTSDCFRGRNCETYTCKSSHTCEYQAKPCSAEQPCIEPLGVCVGNPTN
ncbi:hypothetical protein DICPUDRAFT_78903 [Dictyostelium purpureum]|uniref:Dickkopf N-terminal cysteine-rich domain-containing protein n=1 Tax=Dictyostelium purpureum TaxID=5786 RepID=F0ZKY5_DICPU|nr:uncharacterized protein DICPUDRAFT_78903 [Dictyostelium purpureum]EGC35397.1 hypothetical protein DICPUDRAFT_78903 [Dictyostelium purpureum]|eukprot:XP_003288073.1 hypothetical protein DICPUDRAFT_78903 [Dictyostelium purpureum]